MRIELGDLLAKTNFQSPSLLFSKVSRDRRVEIHTADDNKYYVMNGIQEVMETEDPSVAAKTFNYYANRNLRECI